jgi:hypothetical protein
MALWLVPLIVLDVDDFDEPELCRAGRFGGSYWLGSLGEGKEDGPKSMVGIGPFPSDPPPITTTRPPQDNPMIRMLRSRTTNKASHTLSPIRNPIIRM